MKSLVILVNLLTLYLLAGVHCELYLNTLIDRIVTEEVILYGHSNQQNTVNMSSQAGVGIRIPDHPLFLFHAHLAKRLHIC